MSEAAPFSPRAIALIVGAAVLAFCAFVALAAFAPDFRPGADGGAHALSISGDGFAGLVKLNDALGGTHLMVRDPALLDTRDLLVVTPPPGLDPAALDKVLAKRGEAPTLIVLPKWDTQPIPGHPGWVEWTGLLPRQTALARLAPHLEIMQSDAPRINAHAPADVPRLAVARIGPQPWQQRLGGRGVKPLLLDANGWPVIGAIPGRPIYILAEPDLLDNQGMADPLIARQGWRVIEDLSTTNETAFDLTLDGFAHQRSTLKLLFQPPFAPVTLCVLLAASLAGLHGLARFGAPAPEERAIAFGKRTLVDNAAMLFRAAKKEHRAGHAYALLTRDLAADAAGAPRTLGGEALSACLDAAAPEAGDPPFATLAWHAETAADRTELLAAARALYRWRRNRSR